MEIDLRVVLAKRKLKITDVAKATGISRTTLTALYYEKSQGVKFETLETLCKYLKCPVEELLIIKLDEDDEFEVDENKLEI